MGRIHRSLEKIVAGKIVRNDKAVKRTLYLPFLTIHPPWPPGCLHTSKSRKVDAGPEGGLEGVPLSSNDALKA